MPRATLELKLSKNDLIADKYKVVKKLGEGGCGSVYRCKATKGEAEVAVKVLENASDLARFRREAKVLSGIRHPHVVRLLDRGTHGAHPFLVLEYMEGGSLRDLLDAQGRLGAEEAAWAMVQALRGLRASRTVHRDLKPENILVGRGPGSTTGRMPPLTIGDTKRGCVLKVADFGLAKHPDPGATRLTNTGQVMGTPVYMSPEQCRNTRTVNFRSDIYSLGVILFEMVTGKAPFDATNAYDIMAKHCNDEPKFPRMDQRIKDICARCLAKSPKDRYPSLYTLERDLARVAGLDEPEPDRAGRSWLLITIGILIVGVLIWLLREQITELLTAWWAKGSTR